MPPPPYPEDDIPAAADGVPLPPGQAAPSAHQAFLDSLALFQGRRTVEIRHNGAVYRLQATKAGKLILTK